MQMGYGESQMIAVGLRGFTVVYTTSVVAYIAIDTYKHYNNFVDILMFLT